MDGAKGNQIGCRDFLGIGRERGLRRTPDHERGDSKSRPGLEVVQSSEEVLGPDVEPDLFMKLAKRGVDRALARLDTAARECPLSLVISKSGGSPRENEAGLLLGVSDDGDGDGRGSEAGSGHLSPRKPLKARPKSVAERGSVSEGLHSPIMVASAPGGAPSEREPGGFH